MQYYRRVVTANKLNVKLFEKVASVKKQQDHFIVTTDKDTYLAQKVILASGFYDLPKMLDVPGENLNK